MVHDSSQGVRNRPSSMGGANIKLIGLTKGMIMNDIKPRIVRLGVLQQGPNSENIVENRERILQKVDEIAE